MHQQRVVYVDPESELLLVRHPPQINSLQPIKNQPETPNVQSIILIFDQQTEPPRSLSKPRNSHVNRRKIKITHHYHYNKN